MNKLKNQFMIVIFISAISVWAYNIYEKANLPTKIQPIGKERLSGIVEHAKKFSTSTLDDQVRLTDVQVSSDSSITASYTLFERIDEEEYVALMSKITREQTVEEVCKLDELKELFESGLSLIYEYRYTNNEQVFSFKIQSSDCS